jgi:hypothetical protein
MSTPLEDNVEKYFVALLKTNGSLANLNIKPFDSEEDAKPGIVVEATQKNRRLDGPKGFDVDVRVLFRSTTLDIESCNQVADAIVSTVYSSEPGKTAEEDVFTYLLILDEMTGERSHTKNLRLRERVFPVIARIDE